MLPEELKEHINAYTIEWFKAEEAIKAFERLEGEVMMASVQELRYAGRRFAQVLQIIDSKRPSELSPDELQQLEVHVIEASQNCIKARHDAIDAAVHFIHKRIQGLVESIGIVEVSASFPAFNLLQSEIKEIDKKIVDSRAKRETIDAQYQAILQQHGAKLMAFYEALTTSEKAIRQSLLAKKRLDRRKFWIGCGVSFALGFATSLLATWADRITTPAAKTAPGTGTAPQPASGASQ